MPSRTGDTLMAADIAFDYPEMEKTDHRHLTSYLANSSIETVVDVVEVMREPEVTKNMGGTEDASPAGGSNDLDPELESTRGEQQQPPGNLAVEGGSTSYVYRENLSHEELVQHLEASREGKDEPALRIIFSTDNKYFSDSLNFEGPALSPQTFQYLIKNVGVSPTFFSYITWIDGYLDSANALLRKRNSAGDLVSIQGFYRCMAANAHVARLWFLHNLEKHTSTYIIDGNFGRAKKGIVKWAADDRLRLNLLRPVVIDSLIMGQAAWTWSGEIVASADKLLSYESLPAENYATDGFIDNAVHDLHKLSKRFHILQEELTSMVENINYVLEIHDLLDKAPAAASSTPQRQKAASEDEDTQCTTSVVDSLSFLRFRMERWKRWAVNRRERTGIQIHLFFNLAAQRDNRTNLRIADLTTKIAQETQKDSSAMITIAALTLVFLPGTFVAAIFSMVFFNTSDVKTGAVSMTVASGWWIYPTITIPFTIIIVAAWNMWRKRRDKIQREALGLEGTGPPPVPVHSERVSAWIRTTWWIKILMTLTKAKGQMMPNIATEKSNSNHSTSQEGTQSNSSSSPPPEIGPHFTV